MGGGAVLCRQAAGQCYGFGVEHAVEIDSRGSHRRPRRRKTRRERCAYGDRECLGPGRKRRISRNTIVYLDMEEWQNDFTDSTLAYIRGWVEAIGSTPYRPGLYCRSQNASAVRKAIPAIQSLWVFAHPGNGKNCTFPPTELTAPVGILFDEVDIWQFAQVCQNQKFDGWDAPEIDYNLAHVPSPAGTPILPPTVWTILIGLIVWDGCRWWRFWRRVFEALGISKR